MASEEMERVRNVGIVGQGGVGKTMLADALVFAAGAATRLGRTDEGTSLFDWEPEELKRRITISSSIYHLAWKKHEINIVDTPGYANFLGDTKLCLPALSAMVMVLSPGGEVKVELERIWSWSMPYGLPAIAFVSRLDRDPCELATALKPVGDSLGAKLVPLALPIGSGESLRGYVDLLEERAVLYQGEWGQGSRADIPEELRESAEQSRERLMEMVADADDEILEKYLEKGELSAQEILAALRKGTRSRQFIPVLAGSAASGVGIHAVLEAIVTLLPSTAEVALPTMVDARTGAAVDLRGDATEPFAALVFKTVIDPFAGKLSIFRVLAGSTGTDVQIYNSTQGVKERIGQILRLEGKKQRPVGSAAAGDICAVAKLKETATGDTLCDEKAPVICKVDWAVPAAISFALEPKSKGDEEKATQALQRLMEEDPSLKVDRDEESREIIVSGPGQLHVEVTVEKLKRKYGVEVILKAPRVPYRETIKASASCQGKYKKQSGGRGQYGDTWIKLEPLPRGAGFEFVDQIVGGVIPRQYIPAVEKGIREAMAHGILAGYPVVDFRATLYDGSHHSVDSSEMAFKIAASMGFKACLQQAKPVLLEPIMTMEISVPDECMGDVIGDLNSRRGKVLGVEAKGHVQVIRAQVPMAEVLRYAPDLRSMTSGRGDFQMEFDHYDEVPPHVAEKVIKEAKAAKEGTAGKGD